MRPLRLALLLGGIAFGLAAEWTAYEDTEVALAVADFAVGALLLVCGAAAWDRRPESRVGALMSLAGLTWFLGTLFEPALYLHRGPLIHLFLSYPTGSVPTRLARAVVAVAYVDGAIEPLARNDWLTLALGAAVVAVALRTFRGASGPARRAARPALGAVLVFEGVLALGSVERLVEQDADRAVLWAYDLGIAAAAIVLTVDLLRARWTDAVVAGLVVDLGASDESVRLRDRLSRALGDPSLVLGHVVPTTGELVDETGTPIELPHGGSGRAVTSIDDNGERVAVLVHDEALLADRKLLDSVAAAARIAVANVALQGDTRARADEIAASRRRLVEAGDAQRRRLEQDLRFGAEGRLDRVRTLLASARASTAGDRSPIETLEKELDDARRELREFAHGIHPAVLSEEGLKPALMLLAERSAIPIEIKGRIDRLPASVEVALYFVCSEAVANIAKHAGASGASIELRDEAGRVVVTIADDGVGGASVSRGSGLRGLSDRIEALGGRLAVESPPGRGTRVVAELRASTSERA